jgi:hypothetical protein
MSTVAMVHPVSVVVRYTTLTYETNELRRSWKKCSCPIYASGTLNGHFKRRNTERAVWPDAKTVVGDPQNLGMR